MLKIMFHIIRNKDQNIQSFHLFISKKASKKNLHQQLFFRLLIKTNINELKITFHVINVSQNKCPNIQ